MINYDQQRGGITVTTKYYTINNTNETSYHENNTNKTSYHEKNVTNEIVPASLVGKALANHEKEGKALANHEKDGSHGAKALANQRAVPHLTISHITIKSARFADSGNYTCSAENTNATVRIYVSEGVWRSYNKVFRHSKRKLVLRSKQSSNKV